MRAALWAFPAAYALHVAQEAPGFVDWARRHASPSHSRVDFVRINASLTSDPERAELSADILAVVRGPGRPDPASIVGRLDERRRGVLRITPEKALLHE